jgi:hypothetical protein
VYKMYIQLLISDPYRTKQWALPGSGQGLSKTHIPSGTILVQSVPPHSFCIRSCSSILPIQVTNGTVVESLVGVRFLESLPEGKMSRPQRVLDGHLIPTDTWLR